MEIEILNNELYSKQKIEFKKFTYIYGRNGMGKTTLAKLLERVLGEHEVEEKVYIEDMPKSKFIAKLNDGSMEEKVFLSKNGYVRFDKTGNIIQKSNLGKFYFMYEKDYTEHSIISLPDMSKMRVKLNLLKYSKFLIEKIPELIKSIHENKTNNLLVIIDILKKYKINIEEKILKEKYRDFLTSLWFDLGFRNKNWFQTINKIKKWNIRKLENLIIDLKCSTFSTMFIKSKKISEELADKEIKTIRVLFLFLLIANAMGTEEYGKRNKKNEISRENTFYWHEFISDEISEKIFFERVYDEEWVELKTRRLKLKYKEMIENRQQNEELSKDILAAFDLGEKYKYNDSGSLVLKANNKRIIMLSKSEQKVFDFIKKISEAKTSKHKQITFIFDDPVDSFDEEKALLWSHLLPRIENIINNNSSHQKEVNLIVLSNRWTFINNLLKNGWISAEEKNKIQTLTIAKRRTKSYLKSFNCTRNAIPVFHFEIIDKIAKDKYKKEIPANFPNSLRIFLEYLKILLSEKQIIEDIFKNHNSEYIHFLLNRGSHGSINDFLDSPFMDEEKMRWIAQRITEYVQQNFKNFYNNAFTKMI
ncbi:hypothetical protein MYTO111405_01625 [Mycoplasma todarodis]